MLMADIDADGWVKIIVALGGQLVIVLGAAGLLWARVEKTRRELESNTSVTRSAAAKAERAANNAATAADTASAASVRADTAAKIGQETAETAKEIKTLVNG